MPFSSDPTVALARLGLDMASEQQRVIAHNIANANTPGYTPIRLSFERQLEVLQQVANEPDRIARLLPLVVEPMVESSAGPVALDQEMARMAHNGLSYQTLTKLLTHHFGMLSTAIAEGKR